MAYMTNYKLYNFMEKITQSLSLRVRWLSTKVLILMLIGVVLPIFQANAQLTYCVASNTDAAASGSYISNVTFGSINNTTGSTYPVNGYSYWPTQTTNVMMGSSVNLSVSIDSGTSYGGGIVSVWFDWNQDGTLSSTEWTQVSTSILPGGTVTIPILIPLAATQGITLMRVRSRGVGNPNGAGDACSSMGSGDTEDYNITVVPATPCSGTPTAGTATASIINACGAIPFSVSLTGSTIASGITYQWQSSPTGANAFVNVLGATSMSYLVSNQVVATDYRCVVTCTNSNSTQTSTVVSVGQNPFISCYCTPTYQYSCSNTSENINSFILEGEGSSEIRDLNTGCTTGNYQNRISAFTPVDLLQDSTYDIQVNTNYSSAQYVWASIWIDFNDNGAFESVEQVLKDMPMATSPSFVNASILIPASANPGVHRMRVRANYNATVDACAQGNWGETHDYEVNIIPITCYRPLDVQVSDITKNSATVTVTPNTKNASGITYEYEVRESGKPGSGSVGLALTGTATTNPFTITGLQPLTKYTVYVKTVCSATDSSGWSNEAKISTMCDYPNLITASGKTVCGAQKVDLTAIFDAGTVKWYDTKAKDSLLFVGANFTTPVLTADTSYWVSSEGTIPSEVAEKVGDGTSTSTTYGTTLSHSYGGYKHQHIFTATELIAAGIGPGYVKGLQFEVASAGTTNRNNFTLAIGTTTQNTATNNHIDNGSLTQVYSNVSETFAVGTKTFNFSTPYLWDGVSNIVVQTNWSNQNYGGTSGAFVYHTVSPSRTTVSYADNATASQLLATLTGSTAGSGGTTSSYNERPNTVFIVTAPCESALTEVKVKVEPKPAFELSTYKVTSCEGEATELVTIATNLGGYDSFTWTPSTGVSGDAVNGWTFNSLQEQEFILSAKQSNGICEHLKTVIVFGAKKPIANPNLATTHDICKNSVIELNVLDSTIPNDIEIGSGTTISGANSETSAFVHSAEYSKQQYIYSANELIALGFTDSGYITGLAFNTINSGASMTNGNYRIKMKMSPNTTFLSNNFDTSNFATVYTTSLHTHTFQGWQDITFDNPFYWDGQSNIIVQITQEGIGAGSNNAQTYFTAVAGGNVGIFASSKTDAEPLVGTRTGDRLNVKFKLEQATVTWSPPTNLYVDAAATLPYTSGLNSSVVYTTSSTAGSYTYNALITGVNGCSALQTYTVNVTDVGMPIVQNQTFCKAVLVGNVVVTGHQGAVLKFYNSATSTVEITNISSSGTYYVQAVQGDCKSVRVPFNITIVPLNVPAVQFTQVVCGNGTIADLKASGASGATIKWYSSLNSSVALQMTHVLTNNTTYYASQSLSGCESDRVAVLVNINPIPVALLAQSISICGAMNYGNVDLNQLSGSTLVWYQSATSQQPLSNISQIINGTYYVSQMINGCESPRVQIVVTVQAGGAPTPSSTTQNFCGGGTVSQLVAQVSSGGVALWYNSPTSNTPLLPTDVLMNGTYYVAQRIGNCLSSKVAVAVRVTSALAPAVSDFTLCNGATVSDLFIPQTTGTSYKWYLNNTTQIELGLTDLLTSGFYFVSKVQDGCESTRTQVKVTISSRPTSPTGISPQDFKDYAELNQLVMNQQNIIWYLTYQDAMTGIKPLPYNMPLVHGSIYYAVVIGANGCSSLPTPIEVTITLGINDFDLTKLKYWPNPVDDVFTINYIDRIINVKVFDLNGKLVKSSNYDKQTVELDLSDLSSGTYMINIKTKESSQFVKIIKN